MPDIFISKENQEKKTKPRSGLAKHVHHLASFCRRPIGVNFQDQDEKEEILLFLRRHFITNIPWIFLAIVFILIPPVFLSINSSLAFFDLSNIPPTFIIFFILLYYLVVLNYLLINFMSWFYNVTIVTNERIVDIDFSDIVYHDMAATKLNLIEELHYSQTGFIQTFFNFGNLYIQTAGENPNIEALVFPRPNEAAKIIQDLIGKESNEP